MSYAERPVSRRGRFIFFESKEALFCEALCSIQKQICEEAGRLIEEQKDRRGVARALKFIYREYDANHFLYDSSSTDYSVLMNKVSEEQAKKIEESNLACRQLFLCRPYLKFKIDPDLALSVMYALLMNNKNKEILPYDHMEAFDFMADHLIDSLYE